MRQPRATCFALAAGLLVGCQATPRAPATAGAPASAADMAPAGPVFPDVNRPDVRGTRGAVSSDHPLATAAGHAVLLRGGTATDAAVAMAAVLAVVRPHMNGVGGDAFALFYDGATGVVTALNGSGRAGHRATPSFFTDRGHEEIPGVGAASVSVPGAVAAWIDAHERYGSLPLEELLAPAIRYAREGFPVSWRLRSDFAAQGGDLNDPGRALYLPGGEPPAEGALLRNPALAATLERIAASGRDGFYRGPVAERIADFVEARGGYLTAQDLARHTSTWVEPVSRSYLGHRFWVLPPNTQGVAMLAQMGMAERFDLARMGRGSADYLHTLIEIKKLAFADRDRWVADPEHSDVPVDRMLDPAYLHARADLIDPTRAATDVRSGIGSPGAGGAGEGPGRRKDDGDTVYLTAVDAQGNAVSWIQSLFAGFGSGLLEPETGVLLQNRGALFTLEAGHPNRVAPGKRPYHTLTPSLATRDRGLAFTIGTPGGDSQTQSILQIVNNLLLFGMSPQAAVEAPRYRSYGGTSVAIEDRVPDPVRDELRDRGHRLRVVHGWTSTFGGAQMIRVEPGSGTLTAAADPRREAYALAW